ncbi:MAG: hypothetical protein M3Z21_03155, partial [Pseudomonadota bacterium]|nr:hypothetical protein [Pseudomonadota bacterium]
MLLKEYRDRALGLADLLHAAVLVDEGIVLQKDGSFLAGWHYAGPDLDCASHAEMDALSAQVSAALSTLDDGWMMHVDAIRAPATDYPTSGAFPDPTTALIDEERRGQYQAIGAHFESRYVLTVTYLPPPSVESRLSSLFVSGADTVRDAWGMLVAFRAALDGIEDLLSARLSLARLDSEALLSHLHRAITGLDHPVRVPAIPCYLDALLASQDLVGGFEPKIGDNHIRALSVSGFPMESWPGILDFLNRLPVVYRWSTRFIFMNTPTAERRLRIVRRHWFQKRHTFFQLLYQALNPEAQGQGWENKDALEMAEDADDALAEASGGAVRYGYYTATLILMDEDRKAVDAAAREMRKELGNRGFPARIETVNALEAYLGTLPGHGYQNVRRAPLHTLNLADLLPLTSVWPGREHCPCPFYPPESPPLLVAATAGSTPFRLNLHVGDVGHTLIIGPTGAGKSTIVGLIMAQFFRYPQAQVFAFDKGYSSFPLCQAAGGEHYDIVGEHDTLGLCPLAGIARDGERGWAADWLETLFSVQGIRITPRHRETLTNALRVLAWEAGHSLTDLKNTLQDEDLRRALDPYTLTGPLGGLLDATGDDLGRGRFQVFELEHLMSRGEAQTVPVL